MSAFEATRLSPALGLEISGLDLRDGLNASTASQLDALLARHLLLLFRDQDLAPVQMHAALSALGKPMHQHHSSTLFKDCPDVAALASVASPRDENGKPHALGSACWHSDHINHENPPKCTILHARKLPSSGGDTSFANMRKAYRALPDAMRTRAERLRSVSGMGQGVSIATSTDRESYKKRSVHPLVRTHPVTGEHALYFHPDKLDHFEGLSHQASVAFIEELQREALTPDVIYRHQWRVGDVLLCDNRACVHMAHDDYDHNEGRLMYRMLLQGDRPFFRPVTRPTYD
jgi:taurine dioxygenase